MSEQKEAKIKEHTQTRLPYQKDGLMPHISSKTLDFHYGKHHAGYVKKLNAALKGNSEWGKLGLVDLLQAAKDTPGKILNCAGQHWNHSFYWQCMSGDKDNRGGEPKGYLLEMIKAKFGSFEKFQEQFNAAAAGHFGSGWAWLLIKDGQLKIAQSHDAGNPIATGEGKPLLVVDVWEHAYYIDYQNNRGAYLKGWWNLLDWDFIAEQVPEERRPKK